jgi:hypothetical protein
MNPIYVLIFLVLTACAAPGSGSGGGSTCPADSIVGSWSGTVSGNPDTLVFNSNGSGTGSYCNSTFNYSVSGDQVTISVAGNAGGGCWGTGTISCTWSSTSSSLFLDCSSTVSRYTK